jgi:MFS family permease
MSNPATVPKQRIAENLARHPLQEPHFRRWLTGTIISLFGDQFYLVALPWLALQLTGSGIALGAILTAAALPRSILMLVGGAISDRTSPRKVMIATASARAVVVTMIAVLLSLRALRLWELYALSFGFGLADAFAFPAFQTFLPSLVRPEQLAQANSAAQGAYQISTIAGPAPAAVVVREFGAAWAFLLDALSFLAIIAALLSLPDPPRVATQIKRPSMLASISEGMKYVCRDSALRTLIVLLAVLNFCMLGPMQVGLAYMAKVRFQAPTAYGIWLSVLALGSLAGAVSAGFKRKYHRGNTLLRAASGFAIGSILLVFASGLWRPALILFCMGIMAGFVNVQITAWIQERVERSMLGRVSGVQLFSAFGLTPVSLALAGVLAQWNVRLLFVAGGTLMLAVTGTAALRRTVREIR